MFKSARTVCMMLALALLLCVQAAAQQKVKLEIKSEKGIMSEYLMSVGADIDMDLKELPFPKAKVKVEDLMAAAEIKMYFDTLGVENGEITYDVKAMLDRIKLGGLLGLDGLAMKSTMLSPKITMILAPTGKILELDFADMDVPTENMPKLPGLDNLGFGPGEMSTMIPMVVGLLPGIFPEEEVAVGGTWKQEISMDEMGMGGLFPRVPFEFTLKAVNNGVADIDVKTKGKYDGAILKTFLALIPEIPMGEDVFSIEDFDLLLNWDGAGTMKFDVNAGRILDLNLKTKAQVKLGLNANFSHPDESESAWDANGTVDLVVDTGLKYVGTPNREDVEDMFAPPEDDGDEEPVEFD